MNLKKLFKLQAELDQRIEQEHPWQPGEDRLAKKNLALLVELGELANEWRGFKFWSNDQEARIQVKIPCRNCGGHGEGYFAGYKWTGQKEKCIFCNGTGIEKLKNPLLEEYVDAEHFFISTAIELGVSPDEFCTYDWELMGETHDIFLEIIHNVSAVRFAKEFGLKKQLLRTAHGIFLNLGTQRLGFTWDQIEEAYIKKNQINLQRQNEGY